MMAHVRRKGRLDDEPQLGRLFARFMRNWRRKARASIWSDEGVMPLAGVPYVDHVDSLLRQFVSGPLPDGGSPLPDDAPRNPEKAEFAPGALDGMMARGIFSPAAEDIGSPVINAIARACEQPLKTESVHSVAERLSEIDSPGTIDGLIKALRQLDSINVERLAALARWLCNFGVNRGQVKSGLALVGVAGGPSDADLVSRLGLLGELTLYSVVALRRIVPDWEHAIFDLAKRVDGWGRVAAVELLRGAGDPVVKGWLLRVGYLVPGNEDEVTLNAATIGGLAEALQGDVDEELLHHAGEILGLLATAEQGDTMADYVSGGIAMELYLAHAAESPKTAARLSSLTYLDDYLVGAAHSNSYLSSDVREFLGGSVRDILASPDWTRLVQEALQSPEFDIVRQVLELAPSYGFNRVPIVLGWLRKRPVDSHLWSLAARDADLSTIQELVGVAADVFDFEASPSAPTMSLGVGPDFGASVCLQILLQELGRFPGEGWAVIHYGLSNGLFRARNVSARALEQWAANDFPLGAADFLATRAGIEPDEQLKARLTILSTRARQADD